MERIREASVEELRVIVLTLCDDDDDDMKQRVSSHLRVLQYYMQLPDCMTTIQRVREASKTELCAVLLTICEDRVATLNRALDCLRVLACYKKLQDDSDEVSHKQENNNRSRLDVDGEVGQEGHLACDGTAEMSNTHAPYLEDLLCVHCKRIFNEENNHATACKRHPGKSCYIPRKENGDGAKESKVTALTFFFFFCLSGMLLRFSWSCCHKPANGPGCVEDYHSHDQG
jgi:hypothetical protein